MTCIHEPFGDAFYFGPERMGTRYENDEKAREESGFADSTFQTILDRIDSEKEEVSPVSALLSTFPSSRCWPSFIMLFFRYFGRCFSVIRRFRPMRPLRASFRPNGRLRDGQRQHRFDEHSMAPTMTHSRLLHIAHFFKILEFWFGVRNFMGMKH